jgi:peptide/nickel transport system substrate-binding protein
VRSLNIVMRVEPPTMLEGSVDRSAVHKPLFAATLGAWDLQETPFPILAPSLPQLNTESWRVSPDGRMETSYGLRPGLTWHDGLPLSADDFVFTLRAERARVEWGLERPTAELRNIVDIAAAGPTTVTIRWRAPYAAAAAPDLIPLPRHVLEASLDQGEAEAFGSHPYWTTGWVGAGPYRIDHWERGAFIEGSAFANYALGAPKISRVRVTWSNDPNATLPRLLTGDADIALDGAIRFQQASVLRERWKLRPDGVLLLNPTSLRYIMWQARPEFADPRAILDVRVRRAMLHAIDRAAMAEAMVEDSAMLADTVPPRSSAFYPELDRVLAKHPYDLTRAELLLGEVGLSKGRDGYHGSPGDGRFRIEIRGVSGGQEEQDTTIVNDYFHRAGMDASITLISSATLAVDDRLKGTFPGLSVNNNTLQRGLGIDKWHSSRVAAPENNWVGSNRQGWASAEFDRLYDAWTTTLDHAQASRHLIGAMKVLSDEIALLPLYYNFQVVAHSVALKGPQPITPDSTRYGNIHEWEFR